MENELVCSCHQNGGKKIHNYFVLETLLPVEYNYVICTYCESTDHSINSRFHFNCRTKKNAYEWLDKCSSISKLTFSFDKQDNNTIYARCSCKGTQDRCKTTIEIYLSTNNATNESTMNRSILHQHPSTVIFHYTHDFGEISNMLIEEIDIDDSFKNFSINFKKKPKPKSIAMEQFVHEKLFSLFDDGVTPKQIYSRLKTEIFELFAKHNIDKMQRPGMKWVYDQYYNYIQYKDDCKKAPKPKKKSVNSIKKETVKTSPVINSKINELCKKYVPILPASSPKKNSPKPEPSSPPKSVEPAVTSDQTTPSYVIKSENLDLIPLKLATNDTTIQIKPEPNIVPNPKDNHFFKLMGINDSISQNISLPPGVNSIIILPNQVNLTNNDTSSSNVSSKKPSTSVLPKKEKQPRKPSLKYEDPGEIVFTDRIEDLLPNTKKVSKKSRRKSARIARRKKKIIQFKAVEGIENIICSE